MASVIASVAIFICVNTLNVTVLGGSNVKVGETYPEPGELAVAVATLPLLVFNVTEAVAV